MSCVLDQIQPQIFIFALRFFPLSLSLHFFFNQLNYSETGKIKNILHENAFEYEANEQVSMEER